MSNFVLQMIVNNAAICLGLALVALIVGRTFKRPFLTHLIWLLVLVKMLMPPVFSISTFSVPGMTLADSPVASVNEVRTAGQDAEIGFLPFSSEDEKGFREGSFSTGIRWKQLLFLAWLLGSGIVFLCSLSQVYRFHRLLKKESEPANPEICEMASEAACCLDLRKVPEIRRVSARVSPLVWWIGSRVQIIIPDVLSEQMKAQELRWILAHELAHVRRRDFLIRWLEWLTCVLFWWYPVAWWARRNLRMNEELCCDQMVLSCLNSRPATYGESLLKTVEILSGNRLCKPILASGINSGELLKKRVRIILSNQWKGSSLRWARASILLCALIVLPFGLTSAQTRNKNIGQIPQTEESSNFPSAIRVDSIAYPANFVTPGMRVDILWTGTLPDGSERIASRVIFRNIQVLAVDENVEQNSEGRPQKISVVTFLVTPEQARELALAGSGRIQLALRNPIVDGEDGTEPDGMRAVSILGAKLELPIPQKPTGLPGLIQDGMRAISIRVDNIMGGDEIRPGTRVDVIWTGAPKDGGEGVVSRIILENIQVIASGINGQYVDPNSDGKPQKVVVATLLVTPEQAKELVLAGSGRIQLALRNALDMEEGAASRSRLYSREDSDGLPSIIPDGMRAIAVKVEKVTGGSGTVLPGNRVDVIRTGTLPDGSEGVASRIILENVQVLTADKNMLQNSDRQPRDLLVVLLVTPEQAKELVLAGLDGIQLLVSN